MSLSTFYFILASFTRSNGAVNSAFILYYFLAQNYQSLKEKSFQLFTSLKQLFICFIFTSSIFLPFIIINFLAFCLFCVSNKRPPVWCGDKIFPNIYSHIQKTHWGLGAFAYYQFRKLPNFILASPVVTLISLSTFHYLKTRGWQEVKCLGFHTILEKLDKKKGSLKFTSRNIFVFVVHINFLLLFSLIFMHVEVSTRMIFSSSPFPYWIAASFISRDIKKYQKKLNYKSWKHFSSTTRCLIIYFVVYFFLGCLLHTNFFPWT